MYVTWVNAGGQSTRTLVKKSRYSGFQERVRSKGGYVSRVESAYPSGHRKHVVYGEATLSEGGGVVKKRMAEPNVSHMGLITTGVYKKRMAENDIPKGEVRQRTVIGPVSYEQVSSDIDRAIRSYLTSGSSEPLEKRKILVGLQQTKHDIEVFREEGYSVEKTEGGYVFYKSSEQLQKDLLESKVADVKGMYLGSPVGAGIYQRAAGAFSWEDPLGIYSTFYGVTGQEGKMWETRAKAIMGLESSVEVSKKQYFLFHHPMGTVFAYEAATGPAGTIGISVAGGYALGAGVGALKTAFPLIGETAEAGLVSYGLYEGYKKISPPLREGNVEMLAKYGVQLGLTMPGTIFGYGVGSRAGASWTASAMKSHGSEPIMFGSMFYKQINPITHFKNIWRRAGTERVPIEEITTKEVISGEKTFTESPGYETTLEWFKRGYNPESGYYHTIHAASGKFPKSEIEILNPSRKTDVMGIYVAPKGHANVYFTGLKNVPRYTEFSLKGSGRTFPSLRELLVKDISAPPGYAMKGLKSYLKWQVKTAGDIESQATITYMHMIGSKPEAEAVIGPLSKLSQAEKISNWFARFKGYGHTTKLWGEVVPIYKIKVGVETVGKNIVNKIKTTESKMTDYFHKYYSGKSYRSYFGPTSFGLSSFVSSIISSYKAPSFSYLSSKSKIKSFSYPKISSKTSKILSSKPSSSFSSKRSYLSVSYGDYIPLNDSLAKPIFSSSIAKSGIAKSSFTKLPESFDFKPKPFDLIKFKEIEKRGFRQKVHPVGLVDIDIALPEVVF